MKRGIEVYTDYDETGKWRLNIQKKKGKLTLEEIRETAREYEQDYYFLVLDAFHEEYDDYGFAELQGDHAYLYSAYEKFEKEMWED